MTATSFTQVGIFCIAMDAILHKIVVDGVLDMVWLALGTYLACRIMPPSTPTEKVPLASLQMSSPNFPQGNLHKRINLTEVGVAEKCASLPMTRYKDSPAGHGHEF